MLAQVYEKARNALEYRADNLVRRAAIERILKRRIIINRDPENLADNLLTELKWAKYLSYEEVKQAKKLDMVKILQKYISFLGGKVPPEWIVKIASAEIEEIFNLNTDYKQFTFFAFQVIKQKIEIDNPNLDLFIYFAVDKVYAGSDDEQIAYHIVNLAGQNITRERLDEAFYLFNLAKKSKITSRISKHVRRQMPPLVLLRDIYFFKPSDFKSVVANQEKFLTEAAEVLDLQLKQMSRKIGTAGVRSIIYVFLTKMILAFGLEVPFEIFLFGRLNKLPLILNLLFPPLLMWAVTSQIRLPNKKEKENLVNRAWYIISSFDNLGKEEDVLKNTEDKRKNSFGYLIFSIIYGIFFVGVFGGIVFLLGKIGYTLFSESIFLFFLTIIAFFAYRISQTAKIYLWRPVGEERTTFFDIISLPILTIGSRLSQGLSRLNFLAFAFDFILEAPFKMILGFVDAWAQFLSVKKDEQILE